MTSSRSASGRPRNWALDARLCTVMMLAAAGCGGLCAVVSPAMVMGLLIGLACVILIWQKPQRILPLLIVTYPLEWSKTFFPFLLWEKTIDGASVSIVELFRLVAALAILIWTIRCALKKGHTNVRGRVALVLLALLVFYIGSAALIAQAPGKAWIETLRFAFHVGLFAAIVHLLTEERRFQSFARAIIGMGLLLGLIGIVQFKTGWYIWNTGLENYEAARVNATFSDPNIFARFLIVSFIFAMCLRDRLSLGWACKWLAAPVCVFALMATFSRSGLVVFMVSLLMLQISGIIGGNLNTRVAMIGWLGITGLFIAASEAARTRLEVFSAGVAALGARVALIVTAWRMFLDYPIWGVGIGSFQTTALRDYAPLLPYGGNYVTASHTAAMTIASEQGVIGLVVAAWFFITLRNEVRKVDRSSNMWRYAIAGWVAILAMLISSQSEGRLFDEPMLFMLAALIVAARRLCAQESVATDSE